MRRSRGNHLKYQVFKSESLKHVLGVAKDHAALLNAGIDSSQIQFEPITEEAISASHLWGDNGATFPWECVQRWKLRDYRGFDISLWFGLELCGLAYASPRQSKLCIKIILLEGKPGEDHPLKGFVAPLMLEAIESYATLLGCREIEIEEPAPGAVVWYQTLGFAYDGMNRLVMPTRR